MRSPLQFNISFIPKMTCVKICLFYLVKTQYNNIML